MTVDFFAWAPWVYMAVLPESIVLFLCHPCKCFCVCVGVCICVCVARNFYQTNTNENFFLFSCHKYRRKIYERYKYMHSHSFHLPQNGYALRSENCWIETMKSQKSHIDNRIELTWMRSIPGNGKFMAKISFYLCKSLTLPKIPPMRF